MYLFSNFEETKMNVIINNNLELYNHNYIIESQYRRS